MHDLSDMFVVSERERIRIQGLKKTVFRVDSTWKVMQLSLSTGWLLSISSTKSRLKVQNRLANTRTA